MYGYNERGEAMRLLELARTAQDLCRDALAADCGDASAQLRLLAGLHAARTRACYSGDTWTQRPVDLLANTEFMQAGGGADLDGFCIEGADPARIGDIRRAYGRLLDLEKLDCLMQHLRKMDDRLKKLESVRSEQLAQRLRGALASAQGELRESLAALDARRGERLRLDVFDQQISYPERIARSCGKPLQSEAWVRIPGQCIESFGAYPELILLTAALYKRLKAQGVTRAQLQAGGDFWELPGGAKGLGVYAPDITPDTFQNRVGRALETLGAAAPVEIICYNDVIMARMRADVFEWFERAQESAAAAAESVAAAAEKMPGAQGATEDERLLDIWRLYLAAKKGRAQAHGAAREARSGGHVDILLADDGAYEAFAQLQTLCRARTQGKTPARRAEKQRDPVFLLFAPDTDVTPALWEQTQTRRLELAADAVQNWQTLRAAKSFGKPLALMSNYSAGWEERVKKLLLGCVCMGGGDGCFAADEGAELSADCVRLLTGARGMKHFLACRERFREGGMRLTVRSSGARVTFALEGEQPAESGGLEEWIFRAGPQDCAPAGAKADMRRWLQGGVMRFLQEDAEAVNRQKNKALDLKKRKQAAYNQTKVLHLALSHWLTLRQKEGVEGCVVTLDRAGGIRLRDGKLAGGSLTALDARESTLDDLIECMFAEGENGMNAFLNRIVGHAEYRFVMRRQKKTDTASEYRAFLSGYSAPDADKQA